MNFGNYDFREETGQENRETAGVATGWNHARRQSPAVENIFWLISKMTKNPTPNGVGFSWWGRTDSIAVVSFGNNVRSGCGPARIQQLSCCGTRNSLHAVAHEISTAATRSAR